MNIIKDNIDTLIKESMLARNELRTEVLRAIKNEFLICQTAKNAKPLDEVAILSRMVKQRIDSRDQYISGNRSILAEKENSEIEIISEFLPKKSSITDINIAIYNLCLKTGWYIELEDISSKERIVPKIPKKNMGDVIKQVKAILVNVDGKELSDCIKTYLA